MSHLNFRQEHVLLLITKGLRSKEIASQLGLSERTVKWYVSQLLLVFDASNRTELVGLAMSDRGASVKSISIGMAAADAGTVPLACTIGRCENSQHGSILLPVLPQK